MNKAFRSSLLLVISAAWGCSSSSSPATPSSPTSPASSSSPPTLTGFDIVSTSGDALTAQAGDAVALKVVEKLSDGTTADLPTGSKVKWTSPTTVTTLDPSSTASSPLPSAGSAATAFFIDNPSRPDRNADLTGVLFFVDPGTGKSGAVSVTANVTGSDGHGTATVSIPVGAVPKGDATNGATVFGGAGANCAECHGATGHGTDANQDGTYTIAGQAYDYPAPGLNSEDGGERPGLERGPLRHRRPRGHGQRRPDAAPADARLARDRRSRPGPPEHAGPRPHLRVHEDAGSLRPRENP